jgi:hypothetical protein
MKAGMRRSPGPWPAAALLLALALSGCGGGDDLLTLSETTYDFGEVLQGDTRKHTITLTNNSDRVVGFRARANCACLGVAQTLKPLDPGASQGLTVIFTTVKLPAGRVRGKYITVTTDHPDVPSLRIQLQGNVYRAYDMRPRRFEVGRIEGKPADHEPRTVVIRALEGRTIRLAGATQMPPDLYDITQEPLEPGGLTLTLALRRDARRPQGAYVAHVRLDLEIVAPDGSVRHDAPLVEFKGFWALPPGPPKAPPK